MFEKLLIDWKINIKKNFKNNFFSISTLSIFISILTLYLLKYLLQFEYDSESVKNIAIIDWVLAPITFFYLLISTDQKNLKTYGIYLILAKVLSILFWVLGRDLNILSKTTVLGGLHVNTLFEGLSNIMIAGNIIVEVVVIPLFIFAGTTNAIEYMLVERKISYKRRASSYVFIVVFEIVIFWAFFQFLLYPYFASLSSNLASKELGGVMISNSSSESIMKYIKPIMAFAWFPLLFAINNNRDGNLFLGRNNQLYIATQITFLIKYVNLYQSSPDLFLPIILLSLIAVKIFWFTIIWARMVITNTKHYAEDDFIPIVISTVKHRNKFYKHMKSVEKHNNITKGRA